MEIAEPWFSTNAPSVLIGILQDRFTVILAKKIPELALKVLSVFTTIITKYQSALSKLYNKQEDKLPPEFIISQCNNAFTFYELLEGMIQPVISQGIATEEEVDAHFNQRVIFLKFQSLQTTLLFRLVSKLFKIKLQPIYVQVELAWKKS